MPFTRVILIVLDAAGVGELSDASTYMDAGAATLPNCAKAVGGLNMPNCQKLGLGNIVSIKGIASASNPLAAHGRMAEQSAGKDSTTGHWEIAGLILKNPFPVFPQGFPDPLVKKFEHLARVKIIGNIAASGTEIIERLGEDHLRTGDIILYTSADSVFQLAAHESLYPCEKLYEICQTARDILTGEYAVGRVIARPFVGRPGSFRRTEGRRDFSVVPPDDTLLDVLQLKGIQSLAIGKIHDLFAGRGITHKIKTADNADGMSAISEAVSDDNKHRLIFANLVDGDQLWGHRRDPRNFANSLEEFDRWIPELLGKLRDSDLLIITADHGCDPTFSAHTDHTREYVPLLVYGRRIRSGVKLGTRATFADVGKTVAEIFDVNNTLEGVSFLRDIIEA